MATVTINATVDKHFSKGIRLAEKDGDYTRRWTIWTSERPAEGTPVTVTGELRLKAAEYDGKHYVDHAVNNATIAAQAGTQAPVQAPPAEWDQDRWNAVAGDSDAPF